MLRITVFLSFLSLAGVSEPAEAPNPALTPAGLYQSNDAGASWTGLGDGLPADLEVRDLVEHGGTIYLSATKYGVFVLPESANTWQHCSAGLPTGEKGQLFPTSLAVDGERLVLGTFSQGVFLSDDGGASWRQASRNIPNVVSALLPTDDRLLAGTHDGIWQSDDHGLTWRVLVETGFRINALAEHGGQIFVAKQNGLGVLKGTEVEWANTRSNWAILQFIAHGPHLYATSAQGEVFRTLDGCFWANNQLALRGLPARSLPEALWGGFVPVLPSAEPAGLITATSRGWLVGRGGGC